MKIICYDKNHNVMDEPLEVDERGFTNVIPCMLAEKYRVTSRPLNYFASTLGGIEERLKTKLTPEEFEATWSLSEGDEIVLLTAIKFYENRNFVAMGTGDTVYQLFKNVEYGIAEDVTSYLENFVIDNISEVKFER